MKQTNFKKYIIIFFSFIFILICGTKFILASVLNKINIQPSENTEKIQDKNTIKPPYPKKTSNSNIENIVLLGIDGTDTQNARSDCIMILTLDNIHKKIKLSSIARDSYVNISSIDKKDKITHAYAFGGPYLTMNTINNNFNLDICKYISVNFSSFPKIIDNIGGIEITIKEDELKCINLYIDSINELNSMHSKHINSSGTINADGVQALAYSRIRYTDGGDFERTHRQRIVISQIIQKLKTIPINKYYPIINDILPLVETNLTKNEILLYLSDILSLKDYEIVQKRFPCPEDSCDKMLGGIYYYTFDEEMTKKKLHDFIYKPAD